MLSRFFIPKNATISQVKELFDRAKRDTGAFSSDEAFLGEVFAVLEGSAGPYDIALLKLEWPVTHVTPALPYDRNDEVGQEILMLGWGAFGTGDRGIIEATEVYDGVFRQTRKRYLRD